MHHPRLRLLLAGALIALAANHATAHMAAHAEPLVVTTPAGIASPVDAAMAHAQSTLAAAVAPPLVATRAAVESVLPPPAPALTPGVAPAAVSLILRWEVSGADGYTARLQHPVWPGGGSGITWGIGYDGGQQTARAIRRDWAAHADAARLSTTSGLAGDAARAALPAYRDIVTPFALARQVFETASLPAYQLATRQAFGSRGYDALSANARGALVSMAYNRGTSMVGRANVEKRAIRDDCIPAHDVHCIANQLRAMCRIWTGTPNGPGLCARRMDEAALAESMP